MNRFKLPKKDKITSGFNIPEGYFDTLQSDLTGKLFTDNKKKQYTIISLWGKRLVGMAASLVILATLIWIINPGKTSEMDWNELETFLSYQPNTVNYDIFYLLDEEDIATLEVNLNIDPKDIEIYLYQQDIDPLIME